MHQFKTVKWCFIIYIALFYFQAIDVPGVLAGPADSPPSSSSVDNIEDWIEKKIFNGEIADLQFFPDERKRIISAKFLTQLLTVRRDKKQEKPLKIHIANARIIEEVDLSDKILPNETLLTNCDFDSQFSLKKATSEALLSFEGSRFQMLNFHNATFKNVVILRRVEISDNFWCNGSRFLNPEKPVFSEHIRVGRGASFSAAKFKGGVKFEHAKIGTFLGLDKAEFLGNAFFNNVSIGTFFRIDEAKFNKSAEFKNIDIGGFFKSNDTHFLDPDGIAWFEGMKVGNYANFEKAIFKGDANFNNVGVARYFNFKETRFEKQDGIASFEGMIVGDDAVFDKSIFNGVAKFNNTNIGLSLKSTNTKFTNPNNIISYAGMKAKSLVIFGAIFQGGAEFSRVDLAENFIANHAKFESTKKWAFFDRMRVGGKVHLNKAQFKGPAKFDGADIRGHLIAPEIRFGNENSSPTFIGMKVGEDVNFENSIFKGNADFSDVQCNFFKAKAARFLKLAVFQYHSNTEQKILFERMKINNTVDLQEVQFNNHVSFNDMIVGQDLNATNVQFSNGAEMSLHRANIKGSATFDGAQFTGAVVFDNSIIGGNLNAKNAEFKKEKSAFFRRVNVTGSVNFDEAQFTGAVDFENSVISRFFRAKDAIFDREAFFAGIKIGYNAEFDFTRFNDAVIFEGARIDLNFGGEQMRFENPDVEVSFEGMTVRETVRFNNATFKGELNLKYADFRDLLIHGDGKESTSIKSIDLTRAQVRRQLEIQNTSFVNMLAVSLKVDGPAYLKGLTITNKADLTQSNFSTLKLEDICLPKAEDSLVLDGVDYWSVEAKRISAMDNGRCHEDSERVIIGEEVEESIKYESSIYSDLEAFLKRQGDPGAADRVYIAQKDREREDHKPPVKELYILWAVIAGYGRKPVNTLVFSGIIILIGCIVFSNEYEMVPTEKRKDRRYNYNCLWYSLDLFMPFVDLRTASAWLPEPGRKFAPHWARLQRFLGLILVPIFLAALTGIIK